MDVSSHLWCPWGCWHDLRRLYFWYPGNFCVDEAFLWDLVTWNLIFWVSPVRSTQAIPCQLLPIMFNFGWADWLFEFRPQLTGLVLKRPWTVLLAFLASSTSATTFLTNAAKRTLNGSWGMAVLSLLLLGLRLGVQRTSNRSQEWKISAIQILETVIPSPYDWKFECQIPLLRCAILPSLEPVLRGKWLCSEL